MPEYHSVTNGVERHLPANSPTPIEIVRPAEYEGFACIQEKIKELIPVVKDSTQKELFQLIDQAMLTLNSVKLCEKFQADLQDSMKKALKQVKKIISAYDMRELEIEKTVEELRSLVKTKDRIHDKFDLEFFDNYDLITPGGLKDKACDQLVEAILETYGHQNYGKTMALRRAVENSSWDADYVPDAVIELVKFRYTARDSKLSGEDVRETLILAQQAITDQIRLEKSWAIRNSFKNKNCPSPESLIQTWNLTHEAELPNPLKKLDLILKEPLPKPEVIAQCEASQSEIRQIAETAERIVTEHLNELKDREERMLKQARLERARSFLSAPIQYIRSVTNNYNLAIELGKDASHYGTEKDKDEFVTCLQVTPKPESMMEAAFNSFISNEIAILTKAVNMREASAIDHCIAIIPRIVAHAEITGRSENIKEILELPLLPGWIPGWYEYRREAIQKGFTKSKAGINELAREILAYGRNEGYELPLVPALKNSGGLLRRGLLIQS